MSDGARSWLEKFYFQKKAVEPPAPVSFDLGTKEWTVLAKYGPSPLLESLEYQILAERQVKQLTEALGVPPHLLIQAGIPARESILFRQEYLGTFSPHDPGLAIDLPADTQEEEEEWEVVARTATSTSTRRRKKTTPGRATVSGPTTKNDPIYTWGMQSSKPRNGGEYIQYEVRLNDDGSVTCNCPGWIFKKKTETRGCKHTRHTDIARDAPDFYQRHLRGEQLPTVMPTGEQMMRAMNTRAGKRAAETGKDLMQGFGRFIELED